VVVLTGLLMLQSPVEGVTAGDPGVASGPVVASAESDALSVEVRLAPGTAGPNEIEIVVRDPSGAPLDNGRKADDPANRPEVVLSLPEEQIGPLTVAVQPTSVPGVFTAEMDVSLTGAWEVTVTMRVSLHEQETVTVPITIPLVTAAPHHVQ
jgi:hypothetical protein